MKRYLLIAWMGLFAGIGGSGCSAAVEDETDLGAEETVAESEAALPLNCVGRCVAEYKACVKTTHDYAGCAQDREACKGVCDEKTCEPWEPGCCQGQPTCW
jgi:hypothetical protein